MSEENYMRIIDLRGKKLTRAEMLEAMPRAEMGTNEATDLVQPILDDVKARGAAALRDFAEKFDHIRPENLRVPVEAMKAAVDNGAEVVVAAGFLQGTALKKAAKEFTDTKFVFIDGSPIDGVTNLAAISFREEQCGYLAGYAAVMEGYTKLGFTGGGGGTNDACCRYGYGYVQGAEAAAAEKNVKVEMNYTWKYGESFQPSAELQTLASGWYKNGTEVIFSCGGSIFDSITAAASANDAAVIGVDVDQSYTSDTVITSALKGIGEAAQQALTAAYGSDWANYGGKLTTLGAAEGAVGLPTDTWSLKNWTVDQYNAMFEKIVKGEITIDNDFNKLASTDHVTLNLVK